MAVVVECIVAVSDGVGDANILFIGGAARVCAALSRLFAASARRFDVDGK